MDRGHDGAAQIVDIENWHSDAGEIVKCHDGEPAKCNVDIDALRRVENLLKEKFNEKANVEGFSLVNGVPMFLKRDIHAGYHLEITADFEVNDEKLVLMWENQYKDPQNMSGLNDNWRFVAKTKEASDNNHYTLAFRKGERELSPVLQKEFGVQNADELLSKILANFKSDKAKENLLKTLVGDFAKAIGQIGQEES